MRLNPGEPARTRIHREHTAEAERYQDLDKKLQAAKIRRDTAHSGLTAVRARLHIFRQMMDATRATLSADRVKLSEAEAVLGHARQKLALFDIRLRMERWVGYGMRLARRVGQGTDVPLRPDAQMVILTVWPPHEITAENVREFMEHTMRLRWWDGYVAYQAGNGLDLLERLVTIPPAETHGVLQQLRNILRRYILKRKI